MQPAHEPYGALYDSPIPGQPEPPRWPRIVARITGTVGLAMVGPLALVMVLGTVGNLVDGSGSNNPAVLDFVFMTIIAVTSGTLALGLLIAWWREGLGALLIFAGSGLLIVFTFGFALPFIFPAPIVGILYLLSWALHRTDDTGDNRIDRLSRQIRQAYPGRKQEVF